MRFDQLRSSSGSISINLLAVLHKPFSSGQLVIITIKWDTVGHSFKYFAVEKYCLIELQKLKRSLHHEIT